MNIKTKAKSVKNLKNKNTKCTQRIQPPSEYTTPSHNKATVYT